MTSAKFVLEFECLTLNYSAKLYRLKIVHIFTIVPNLNVSNPKESEACNLMIRHVKIGLDWTANRYQLLVEGQYSICELNT